MPARRTATRPLFASASLELLHAFALLQDDVMDASSSRRGRPAAHVQFGQWHRQRGLSGSADRFGESAAILLGDLCLIWAEQMLRESGIEHRRLQQAWPRYDAMRTELAMGQFADLANDVRDLPSMAAVLEVARRKSGNYTVRRPLEIGAAMSGCSDRTFVGAGPLRRSGGRSVSAARRRAGGIRRRDGHRQTQTGRISSSARPPAWSSPHTTWPTPRPAGSSTDLMNSDDLDDSAIERWRTLIVATGAVQWIEDTIERSGRVGAQGTRRASAIDESRADRAGEHGRRVHGACRMTLSRREVLR